ncbi:MAG TPA: NifU family protein [bacterium]|nr:NifU family protein [bacterium]
MTPKASAEVIARVEAALDQVRPAIRRDGGNVRLVEITPENVAVVEFQGHCVGCPSSAVTLRLGVARAIRAAVPEIADVREAPPQRPPGTSGVYVDPQAPARPPIISPFANEEPQG